MATTFVCPKGHSSAESDFCSECGARIQGAAAATPVTNDANAGKVCPDCNGPGPAAGVNFCEICGYNFVTQTSGQFPSSVKPAPVQAPRPPQPATATANSGFKLIVQVDATLKTADSPEAPASSAPLTYLVDKPVSLIGRRSEARAIFPDIPLDGDSAVSHRHGLISQTADGQLIYRDLSSANGTRLNGADVTPLVDTPLKAGDQLTLGHWTRISVEPNA